MEPVRREERSVRRKEKVETIETPHTSHLTPHGTLYIVATPIGNLEDMTFRAVRILKEVDLIAAEDTRHSRKLLSHFGITKPLTSYFDHNKTLKGESLLARLRDGASVALISDAGTPCISDPGYQLVRDAVAAGITVVPGASATVAALSASGLPTDAFTFAGFLPNRQGNRRERLAELKDEGRVVVFYEAPHRLRAALADLREVCGDRQVVIARELTKLYEEFVRGSVTEVLASFAEREVKGEIVLLVAPSADTPAEVDPDDLLKRHITDPTLSFRDMVSRVAAETGLPRSEIYARALALRKNISSASVRRR
jgi:16S rRNA (cytidine1402-2'-O)-methyltransferase